MIKGLLVGFGIMVVLALIPIVHIVGIPFGPFVGGYFGISAAGPHSGSRAGKALVYGTLLGALVGLVLGAVAAALTVATGLNSALLWLTAVFLTLYTASMSSLGAMYAQLRPAGQDPGPEGVTQP